MLVFGATGGTGAAIVHTAQAHDFDVRVFVRDGSRASQLFNGFIGRLQIIEGDAMNADDVRRAFGSTPDAVMCSLGIYQRQSGRDDLTQATAHIIAAMQATGSKRLVCISSLGVGDSCGQGDFITRLLQKTALRHTLADKELQEESIRKSTLDWTIIRPTRLLNDGGPPYCQHWVGEQPARKMPWAVNRAQVARLALACLDHPQTIRTALNVTGSLSMPQSAG
jgi:uncharacterized protein YbjT (DUF2867 family)